jgi:glycerol-3-phosphate dehydrogenase subunit B
VVDVLNTTALPGDPASILAADEYSAPIPSEPVLHPTSVSPQISPAHPEQSLMDVIVVGAGFSGLITAWQAAQMNCKVRVITRGWGAPYWSAGCVDILGYRSPDYSAMVVSPYESLERLIGSTPEHPYALAGLEVIENAVRSFQVLCEASQYPLFGSLDKNILIPTSLGSLRPSCLVPATMISGDSSLRAPMVIVGFDRFNDFFPSLISSNLNALGILSGDITLELPSLRTRKILNGLILARLFDDPEFRHEVITTLKPRLGKFERIGFPAVLGINHPLEVLEHLQSGLGLPVFEIPGLPPSIPGIRLQNLLISAIQRGHGVVQNGMYVTNFGTDGEIIHTLFSEAASRQLSHFAKTYVLATGGILGGGISVDHGYAQERVFGLPLTPALQPSQWFHDKFLVNQGHPLFRTGIHTDVEFHPLNDSGEVIFSNLHIVGAALANCDPIRERSLEGIALASGFKVARIIAERSR